MAERDLPSIAELAGAIPDAAPSLGQQLRQAEADLRDCRARLAALVEALDNEDTARAAARHGDAGSRRYWLASQEDIRTYRRQSRAYLAAHPEGGQDADDPPPFREPRMEPLADAMARKQRCREYVRALEAVAQAVRDVYATGSGGYDWVPIVNALAALDALEGGTDG